MHIMAGINVQLFHVIALLHYAKWEHVQEDNGPHGGTDRNGIGTFWQALVGEGVNNGHVAADADACEQQNGAVHVAVKHRSGSSTHHFPKNPVVPIDVVHYFEGQHDAEEQVWNCQVCVEDGSAHGPDPEEQHPQNDSVRRYTQ